MKSVMPDTTDLEISPMDINEQRHPIIWLAPWCDGCDKYDCSNDGGRTWCKDNVYETCVECGREPVKYVVAPDSSSPARRWDDKLKMYVYPD
jgi:hypothetical protein